MRYLILLAFLIIPAYFAATFSYSFCDQPIFYRIDTVDPKFNITREEFETDVKEASQIWNNVWQKNLFTYDPKGDLNINLIYDDRQSLTQEISQLEKTVSSEKQTLKPKVSEFQKLSSDFKQKVAGLNKTIDYWNSQGGAPEQEYQKLISQQQELKAEAQRLNEMAENLSLSTDQYNAEVDQLNQTISTFNEALAGRPEEGIFRSAENRIEIYFNINKQELVHTLAHELGHALTLPHNLNPKAIMYYKTNQSLAVSPEDLAALEKACRRYSSLELVQSYLTNILAKYQLTMI